VLGSCLPSRAPGGCGGLISSPRFLSKQVSLQTSRPVGLREAPRRAEAWADLASGLKRGFKSRSRPGWAHGTLVESHVVSRDLKSDARHSLASTRSPSHILRCYPVTTLEANIEATRSSVFYAQQWGCCCWGWPIAWACLFGVSTLGHASLQPCVRPLLFSLLQANLLLGVHVSLYNGALQTLSALRMFLACPTVM
jgi:hypothetical protein